MKEILKANQILDQVIDAGENRVKNSSSIRVFVLAMMAGIFIALAAQGSTVASFNLFKDPEKLGIAKLVTGLVFTPGIVLVVMAGSELFTGNTMMVASVLDKKIKIVELLKSWLLVYLGNFVGAIIIAFLVYKSNQWSSGDMDLAARTILTANTKVNYNFSTAFILGILCNLLVCLAVWMSFGADTGTTKILAVMLPIILFVVSGFEHSVANMYYIPAGIFASSNEAYAAASGLGADVLANLNWFSFIVKNLIPVTLGNIVGGGFFVATMYWLAYRKG